MGGNSTAMYLLSVETSAFVLPALPALSAFERAGSGTFRIDRGDRYGIMAVAMMRYWENGSLSMRRTNR